MWSKKVLLAIKGAGARHLIGKDSDSPPSPLNFFSRQQG
jgi:hypothetical protein